MSFMRTVLTPLIVFGLAAIGTAAGATYVADLLAYRAPEPAVDAYTPEAYSSATLRITGALDEHLARRVASASDSGRVAAVLVREQDLVTCEDLGRQLRSLRAALTPADRFEVWAPMADTAAVRGFLEAERIGGVRIRDVAAAGVLADRTDLPTPAALVIGRDGALLEGIAHPQRFRNLRPRSFAEELSSLRASAVPAPVP